MRNWCGMIWVDDSTGKRLLFPWLSSFLAWHGYLDHSETFIRFCCYLHLTEMLSARGGASKTQVAWRWPIGR